MKRQTLITSNEQYDFRSQVNSKLADGYTVVPGTMVTSVSVCNYAGSYNSEGHTHTKTVEAWAVVVER